MDSGGYLGMLLLIIKHDNLNGYKRILTADHESQRKIYTFSYITNHKQKKKEKRREKCTENCTEKDSESFPLSSPWFFPFWVST